MRGLNLTRSDRRALGLLIGVVMVVVGAQLACNRLLDSSEPLEFTAKVESTEISPSGKHKAVLYVEDCAEACGTKNNVCVCAQGEDCPGEDSRNVVFESDIGPRTHVPEKGDPVWVKLHWLSDSKLRITYAGDAQVSQKKKSIAVDGSWFHRPKTISIDYQVK